MGRYVHKDMYKPSGHFPAGCVSASLWVYGFKGCFFPVLLPFTFVPANTPCQEKKYQKGNKTVAYVIEGFRQAKDKKGIALFRGHYFRPGYSTERNSMIKELPEHPDDHRGKGKEVRDNTPQCH
jgi:hypothetical protein